jgi:hypothetical protein
MIITITYYHLTKSNYFSDRLLILWILAYSERPNYTIYIQFVNRYKARCKWIHCSPIDFLQKNKQRYNQEEKKESFPQENTIPQKDSRTWSISIENWTWNKISDGKNCPSLDNL